MILLEDTHFIHTWESIIFQTEKFFVNKCDLDVSKGVEQNSNLGRPRDQYRGKGEGKGKGIRHEHSCYDNRCGRKDGTYNALEDDVTY